jgi:putative nucleotidyltransferase with HDIG domain
MVTYRVEQFIQEASVLPPLPQTAQKALALVRDPDTNASALAKILSSDQVLTARVLRWANSAYYGMENRIVTMQQAIVVLGMDIIQELVMTCSVSDFMNRPLPGYGLERGELWLHAMGTAVGAQLISKHHHLQMDEESYFGGLLCDIGKLIFEKHIHEIDLNLDEWQSCSFLEVERACFGLDHARLGAELARHWHLPEELVSAIELHHEPHRATKQKDLVAAIHVADVSMKVLGIGIGVDGLRYPLEEDALQQLDMTWNDLLALSEQVSEQLTHAKQLVEFE